MTITARLFASFREKVGSNRLELSLGPRPTVRDLLDELGRRHPALAPLLDGALVAVNLEYVGPDYLLHEGDEVALIPPVSGGSEGRT